MKMYKIGLIIMLLVQLLSVNALPPILQNKDIKSHPPRVTRTCCAFGSNMKIIGVPFYQLNPVIDKSNIGNHEYLGGKNEGNGILYTKKGGFIDLGHLREWADWTAFLYLYIQENCGEDVDKKLLGVEGGMRTLQLMNIEELNDEDLLHLAGAVAFDMSLWHEIVTGYGVSAAPFISEKFSSFSAEDVYSNLLGIELAKQAIFSNEDYNTVFTKLLNEKLLELEVVNTIEETYAAMEAVESIWWSREYSIPSKSITIKRNYFEGDCVIPWLLPESDTLEASKMCLIKNSSGDVCLSDYYDLNIRVNRKIPLKFILPNHQGRMISDSNFDTFSANVKFIFEENEGRNKVRSK